MSTQEQIRTELEKVSIRYNEMRAMDPQPYKGDDANMLAAAISENVSSSAYVKIDDENCKVTVDHGDSKVDIITIQKTGVNEKNQPILVGQIHSGGKSVTAPNWFLQRFFKKCMNGGARRGSNRGAGKEISELFSLASVAG